MGAKLNAGKTHNAMLKRLGIFTATYKKIKKEAINQ